MSLWCHGSCPSLASSTKLTCDLIVAEVEYHPTIKAQAEESEHQLRQRRYAADAGHLPTVAEADGQAGQEEAAPQAAHQQTQPPPATEEESTHLCTVTRVPLTPDDDPTLPNSGNRTPEAGMVPDTSTEYMASNVGSAQAPESGEEATLAPESGEEEARSFPISIRPASNSLDPEPEGKDNPSFSPSPEHEPVPAENTAPQPPEAAAQAPAPAATSSASSLSSPAIQQTTPAVRGNEDLGTLNEPPIARQRIAQQGTSRERKGSVGAENRRMREEAEARAAAAPSGRQPSPVPARGRGTSRGTSTRRGFGAPEEAVAAAQPQPVTEQPQRAVPPVQTWQERHTSETRRPPNWRNGEDDRNLGNKRPRCTSEDHQQQQEQSEVNPNPCRAYTGTSQGVERATMRPRLYDNFNVVTTGPDKGTGMTAICSSIRLNKDPDEFQFKAKRVYITAPNERLNCNDFMRAFVAACNRHLLAPTHISFNPGYMKYYDRPMPITYCHVLFATRGDAQQAHRHFHRILDLFESYAAGWWKGGPPVEPARDMHDLVNGRHLAGRWEVFIWR